MIVLGITGATGAGKTSALRVLEKLGAVLIDCDALYYEMLKENEGLRQALCDAFGSDVFTAAGELDRQTLGNRVFGNPAELEKLNRIIFHHLCAEVDRRIAVHTILGKRCVAVDGVNLIEAREAGYFRCDRMIGVTADEAVRLRRIMKRDGISEEYAKKRMAAQKPSRFYDEHCDEVVENNFDTQQQFEASMEAFFEDLLKKCEKEKEHGNERA